MNIIVKKSKIHGRGVFANKDFKKNEIVIKWDISHLISRNEFENLKSKDKRYVSYFKNGKYILHKAPEKYVNHSCNANTKTKNNADVALRNIKKGEEITANYLKEKVPGLKMKCNCGSKNCIKMLKSD